MNTVTFGLRPLVHGSYTLKLKSEGSVHGRVSLNGILLFDTFPDGHEQTRAVSLASQNNLELELEIMARL